MYEPAGVDSVIVFVITNSSNIAGKAAFLAKYQSFSEQNIHHILANTDAAFHDDEKVQMGIQANRIIRKLRMENEQRANSSNLQYRDFELETPDGGTARISDYVGKSKYLLVDFWATWCGPCIAGMPEMKNLYEKYRGKGIGIIGISLDDERERDHWRQVQARIDTPWPQLGYLKGTDSDLANAFIVSDIPYVVIIDDTGTIVQYVRMPTWDSNLARVLEELTGE
jgi:thiol-disulfide isomerase/thioredoxin